MNATKSASAGAVSPRRWVPPSDRETPTVGPLAPALVSGYELRYRADGEYGWSTNPRRATSRTNTLQDQINDEGDTFHREETYSSGEKVICVGTTDGRTANYRLTLDIR